MDTRNNDVYGNLIGTSIDGRAPLGNRFEGVYIRNAVSNTIGGAESGRGNLIAANGRSGVRLYAADLNVVAGNRIGTRPPGAAALGNDDYGVQLESGAQHNVIGPGNTISHNGRVGVLVYGLATKYNTISENSIFDNDERPISLGSGLNAGNENIIEPLVSGTGIEWAEGVACPRCTVEVFSGDRDDWPEYEGSVTALATGVWRWEGLRSNTSVQATATDSSGNTSEFSTCFDPKELNDDFDHAIAIDTSWARHPSRICNRNDVDFFTVAAEAGEVLTVELDVPRPRDQVQRGLDFAQDRLDQADAFVEVADKVTEVVATATVHARRLSRRTLICGAVAAVCGIAVIMIIKKRRRAGVDQETEEILT